jgi:hypothetical protein
MPDVESRSGAVRTMGLGSVLCETFSGLEPVPATEFTIVAFVLLAMPHAACRMPHAAC